MQMALEDQEKNTALKNKQSAKADDRRRWAIYNSAKTNLKHLFPILLHELCQCIEEPEQIRGRPRLSLRDMIFCAVFKVFLKSPSRQFAEDIREACRNELIARPPHFNSVSNYLNKKFLATKLTKLIEISSIPLEAVEVNFAVDSTGLSTCRYARWLNEREMKEQSRREWIKVHLICGVKTKIVTSVITTPGKDADSPYFGRLVGTTVRNFKMQEVYADKGYLGGQNMRYAHLAGARPFIPFKSNNKLDADFKSTIWQQALYMFLHNQAEFRAHYNKRNNVETVFHMIKSMSGSRLFSVSREAQFNEALCKVLCHNICVLIQAMYELGISPSFCSEASYDLKSEKAKPLGERLSMGELTKMRTRITASKKRKRLSRNQVTEIQKSQMLLFEKSSHSSESQE